jgi:hypothetical protein
MKAAFTLIPAESGRLIAKVVVLMEEIKIAQQRAYIICRVNQGEPPLKGFKGTCEKCAYTCKYAGTKLENLPAWLTD